MGDVRKWSYNDIKIKLENLKKIINPYEIEHQIRIGKRYTDDETDAMNIAYYNLKRFYSKIKGSRYGVERLVSYKPRQRTYFDYVDYKSLWNDTNYSSTWTITTNSNGYNWNY